MGRESAGVGRSPGWIDRLCALPSGAGFVLAAALCIFAAHALFGALRTEAGMAMSAAWAVLLGVVLVLPWGRKALKSSPVLVAPGLLFMLTIAAAVWSLTPWVPGGPHPAWTYVGVRGAASIDPSNTIVEIVKLLGLACAFLCGTAIGSSDPRARLGLKTLVWMGAAYGAATLVAFLAGAGDPTQPGRLDAQLMSPNTAGTLFGILTVLAIAAASQAIRKGSSDPNSRDGLVARAGPFLAAALFLAICLMSTASRTAIAATAIAVAVQLFWDAVSYRAKKRWIAVGAVLLLLVGAGLFVAGGDRLFGRLSTVGADADGRALIASIHWKAFLASPLSGYGLGSFDAVHRSLLIPSTFPMLWAVRAAHNVYLQWLEEAGLIGALPMFLCIGAVVALTVRGALRRTRMQGWLHALLACDLILLLHGAADFALQTPSMAAFWAVLLGLQFALSQGSGKARKEWGWIEAGAGALATASACLAILVVLALHNGGPAPALRLAGGYDLNAQQRIERRPPDLSGALGATRTALSLSPYDISAWLRLAYLDTLRRGTLGPDGVTALQKSYDLIGIDSETAVWRIGFCLEHWPELTAELRVEVTAEQAALAGSPPHRKLLLAALQKVRNPAGRLVAAIWSTSLK